MDCSGNIECIDIVKKYYSEEKETAKYLKGEGALKQTKRNGNNMKKIIIAAVLFAMVACDSPSGSNTVEEVVYKYQYEFKNDRNEDVLLHFSREYVVDKEGKDTRGRYSYLDSAVSEFDSIAVPVDSIVSVWSNNDTLMVLPQYLIEKIAGFERFRVVEYGHGLKWLSDDRDF